MGISCCLQIYQLTNKFQFDTRENNLQVGWSSTGADLRERLWHMRYSELDCTRPWATWSYFGVSFNFEVVLALTKGLDQTTFRGPCQPRLFYDCPRKLPDLAEHSCAAAREELLLCGASLPCRPGAAASRWALQASFAKCDWEEHASAEPQHLPAAPVIRSALLCRHCYLAPCATESRMRRVSAFEFSIKTLIFLIESALTISFKTPDKNSSVWKLAGV